MIQITEFRLGNLLLIEGEIQQLSAMGREGYDEDSDTLIGYWNGGEIRYEPSSSEKVQAVPLTEDLLQRCGFTFHPHFHYWQKLSGVPGIGVEMELDRDFTAVDFSHRPILKEVKYLHHLQNLYFALKRKELSISLPLVKKHGRENAPLALETTS